LLQFGLELSRDIFLFTNHVLHLGAVGDALVEFVGRLLVDVIEIGPLFRSDCPLRIVVGRDGEIVARFFALR
jgi:hypothetical protein